MAAPRTRLNKNQHGDMQSSFGSGLRKKDVHEAHAAGESIQNNGSEHVGGVSTANNNDGAVQSEAEEQTQ